MPGTGLRRIYPRSTGYRAPDLPCPPSHISENSLITKNGIEAGQSYCNSTWDTVSCWPTTLSGRLAVLPCPSEVDGVRYNTSQNASRMCFENATWQVRSDYTQCKPLPLDYDDSNSIHNYTVRIIYYVGFTVSLIALIIALSIFLHFRNLRCLRNKIHCHLIVTFMLRNLLWLIMNSVLPLLTADEDNIVHQWVCKLMVAVYNYLQVTNFFWMLVEGLYLHTMIVWAFSIDKVRLWHYVVLGWFAPAIVIIVWSTVKGLFENEACWLPMKNTYYDYIYIAPILIVLLINLIFLASIMYILITKLRASNTIQTRQYRKAVKATLILLPLLGVTYVLFITPPSDDMISKRIFVYFNAVLQSTQGLAVSVFYCFFNGEVRGTITSRLQRWQDGRSFATKYSRASMATTPEGHGLRAGSIHSTNTANSLLGNGKISASSSMNKDCFQNNNGKNGASENGATTAMLRDEAL